MVEMRSAANRVARAGMVVGGLGLATSLFVIVRLFETWRIGPGAPAHAVSVLRLRLRYPRPTLDAMIVLALAIVGFLATVLALAGAAREALAARRLHRALAPARERPF